MAKKDDRIKIKLRSTESSYVYHTMKSKRNTPERIQLRKYDPILRRHVIFKEHK